MNGGGHFGKIKMPLPKNISKGKIKCAFLRAFQKEK
jgi:hypothetical protein